MKKYCKEDQKELAIWAIKCVERILPLFERAYPTDVRPRKALETCKEWIRTGDFKMSVIRGASLSAHAAARDVKENIVAFNVATAHVPQHAFGVFYALRAIAAEYSENAEERVMEEYNWQAQNISKHLKDEYLKRVVVKKRKNGLFITIQKDKDF
ncbi:MAG: hypothetical protein JXR64_00810 [Spirochaetales bacterium]|nr:hypothetical protein [Spirochaetales bacterium]